MVPFFLTSRGFRSRGGNVYQEIHSSRIHRFVTCACLFPHSALSLIEFFKFLLIFKLLLNFFRIICKIDCTWFNHWHVHQKRPQILTFLGGGSVVVFDDFKENVT